MELVKSFLFLTVVFLASHAWAQDQALLVDRSGSMKPYYEEGFVQTLGNEILSTLRSHGDVQVLAFSVEVTPLSDLMAIERLPLGPYTYLDRAMGSALGKPYRIVWLLTADSEASRSRFRGHPDHRSEMIPIRIPGKPITLQQASEA